MTQYGSAAGLQLKPNSDRSDPVLENETALVEMKPVPTKKQKGQQRHAFKKAKRQLEEYHREALDDKFHKGLRIIAILASFLLVISLVLGHEYSVPVSMAFMLICQSHFSKMFKSRDRIAELNAAYGNSKTGAPW